MATGAAGQLPHEAAAAAKARGDAALGAKKYQEAVAHFTEAIGHDPASHVLFSNRSACWAALEEFGAALADARACVELRPDWPRGHARAGLAELRLCRPEAAAGCYARALELAPDDGAAQRGAREAAEASGGPRRGAEVVGWGRRRVWVPFALADSRAGAALAVEREWPPEWPYGEGDFRRQDERADTGFYRQPRFLTHIDDGAIGALRRFYACQFAAAPAGEYAVLDVCSSWVSHYPLFFRPARVAVTGINGQELAANRQATEHVVADLNVEPRLPFGSEEFDFVTNVVSVDYLNKPREVFQEMHRVTKPGGLAIISFSNRCFPTKAIAMWVADMNDGPGHCEIVGNYFHFNPAGGWQDVLSVDISPDPGRSDPVWVVTAVKVAGGSRE